MELRDLSSARRASLASCRLTLAVLAGTFDAYVLHVPRGVDAGQLLAAGLAVLADRILRHRDPILRLVNHAGRLGASRICGSRSRQATKPMCGRLGVFAEARHPSLLLRPLFRETH